MSDPTHKERLLADVLGEGLSADFRTGLLDETLRLARRRRRVRQLRGVASALAVLAALGVLVWLRIPPGRAPAGLPAKPYTLVRTQPLPPAAWVETVPLPASSIVASVETGHIVLTAEAGVRVRDLTDDELLAMVPKPAALVRFGPHSAELVFVNQTDQDKLLRN